MAASAAPPPAATNPSKTPIDRFAIGLAFAGGIGRLPVSPGTFGSLPGLVVGVGLHVGVRRLWPGMDPWSQTFVTVAVLVAITIVAWWAIHRTERVLGIHDDQRIVIDEVVGQAITLAFVAPTVWSVMAGFALFRLLDIWKPLAIGWIDRRGPGAFGTLFDDILAGALAALVICAVF